MPPQYRGKTVDQVVHGREETIVGLLRQDGAVLLREAAANCRLKKGDRILCARTV